MHRKLGGMSIQETVLKIKGSGQGTRILMECLGLAGILGIAFFAYWRFSVPTQQTSLPAAAEQAAVGQEASRAPITLQIPSTPPVTTPPSNLHPSVSPAASHLPLAGEETGHNFVASKTGKVYYPLSCKAYNRIKPANRIYFSTETEAKAKHTLSKSCT